MVVVFGPYSSRKEAIMNKRGLIGPALLAVLVALFTPLHAGEIVVGGPGGPTEPPDPGQGGESEEEHNPTTLCTVYPGEGPLALLSCLQYGIQNPLPQCLPEPT